MSVFVKSKNNILEIIKTHKALFGPFECVYLFGSAMRLGCIPHDIDILIIYASYSQEIENASLEASTVLQKETGLPIDLTMLSVEEEKDTEFLKKIAPHYLKIK